uniref:Uncharacterized protein n=1 Tax=Fomitiporia mediterranea TaxID=208960 RepID=A0A5B9RJY8_9AGAM|nr:hypothetical protein Fomme_000049 [Fomitiporia mediterranea]QEG57045.1 hypothetical protein Fomme_000049 [Fomitiporia mediterranea]
MNQMTKLIKLIKKQIINIGEIYLSVLALPSVYRCNIKLVTLLIIFILLLSICFNTGLYLYFGSQLTNLFITGSIFYVIFLKFNFILRIFNTLLYLPVNLYKNYHFNKNNKDNIKYIPTCEVLISYYLFNFICSIIVIQVIFKIEQNLSIYNIQLGDFTYLYSIIACPILALLYIDYITGEEFKINNIKKGKLSTTIHFLLFVLLIYTTVVLITNFIDPIRCSSNCDNQQVNQNAQNSNKASNLQTNSNNQGSPNSSSSSLIKLNKENKLALTNKQVNYNSQIVANINNNGVRDNINSNPILSINYSEQIKEFKIIRKLDLDTKLYNHFIDLNQSINNQLVPVSDNQVNPINNSNLKPQLNIIKSQDILYNPSTSLFSEIRYIDFYEIFNNINNSSKNQFEFETNLSKLINFAIEQDSINLFLKNAKDNLFEKDFSVLNNKLIHLNNFYSVKINWENKSQLLIIKGASIFDLYTNLKKDIEAISSEQFNEEISIKKDAYDLLHSCLVIYEPSLESNFLLNKLLRDSLKSYSWIESLAQATFNNIYENNKFIYWANFKAFTFCYEDPFEINQSKVIDIIPGDSKLNLFNYIK